MVREVEARFLLRDAAPADSEAIIAVHFAAVHETASKSYSPEILDAWSGKPEETRYRRISEAIAGGTEIIIVAVDSAGVCGFGSVVPDENELRAVYVHPRAGRQGVGSLIIRELERRAAARHVPSLELVASLNALEFYRREGYEVLSHGSHRLPNGQEMPCVEMRKSLKAAADGD